MSTKPFPFRLYLVVSEEACDGKDFLKVTEEALKGGVDLVQLREKHDSFDVFLDKALRLKELLSKYGVPLIINDNLEVAQKAGAMGIHVGNTDVAPIQVKSEWESCDILGYSIEYIEQLDTEQTSVSNYLGISPVYNTDTKTNTVTTWGLEGIKKIRSITDKPLVAIGNMNVTNARAVIEAGADCIAVVSAICAATSPKKAAQNLLTEIEKGIKSRSNIINS